MDNQSAIDLIRKEINQHLRVDGLAEAEMACQRLLQLVPEDVPTWLQLGQIRLRLNRYQDADEAIRRAIALEPEQRSARLALGALLVAQQRWSEAAQTYRELLHQDPQDAASWAVFGTALWALGDLASADEAYQRSLQVDNQNAETIGNYAKLLLQRWGSREWAKAFERCLGRGAAVAHAWLAASDAFVLGRNFGPAAAALSYALPAVSADSRVHDRIRWFLRSGLLELAEPLVTQLAQAEPNSPSALVLLTSLRQRQMRPEEAAEALRSLLLVKPDSLHHSILLTLLQYGDGANPDNFLNYHRTWDRLYAKLLFPEAPPRIDPHIATRRLRLGFVSNDFVSNPVAYMVLPVLERLDKSKCEIACYLVDRTAGLDEYTERFRDVSDRWHYLLDKSNEEIAETIRQDQVDILFDLGGHNGTRLIVFAMKPAPLQVTWLGYPGTTGMQAMDYLLADRFHVQPGEERYYSEKILRMPHGYACYAPPNGIPDVGPLPALSQGRITFGSFNNPLKLSPATIETWSMVLSAVPGSQLLLKYIGFEQEQLKDRIKVAFAQQSIHLDRIVIESCEPSPRSLMAAYNRVDLGLDPMPYSGGLTTCEALWMGVPVITLPGRTLAGRHSSSHLSNAGFAQFIAKDRAEYVNLAVQWASRLQDLSTLRAQMREQVRHSPLGDASTFATDFLALMNEIVQPQAFKR